MSTALNGSLIKALEILDLFSAERPEVSAKTVSESLDMNPATAHRFLLTLEHTGYLVSPRRGQFTLGQRLEDLGKLAFEISPLPSLARPIVEAISRELNESVMACRLGRSGPLCIASCSSSRPIRVSADVGATLPLTVTAQGKLFLADMQKEERIAWSKTELQAAGLEQTPATIAALEEEISSVQERGFATNLGENESEIAAVAVPVRGSRGETIVTLSVFGILSSFDDVMLERAKIALFEGAESLDAAFRHRVRERAMKFGQSQRRGQSVR